MKRLRARRWMPLAGVAALLAAVLVSPSRRVDAERSPGPSVDAGYCTIVSSGGVGTATDYTIAAGEGVLQPLGEVESFWMCSLNVAPVSFSGYTFTIRYWDPNSLAPTAGAIALRTYSFPLTAVVYNFSQHSVLDVVTRALHSVAEPPPVEYSMEYAVGLQSTPQVARLVQNDLSQAAPARRILSGGALETLPGSHPVFVHSVCGSSEFVQDLRVVQCVWKSDAPLGQGIYEFYQRFRVPVATTIFRGDVALDSWIGPAIAWGRLKIADAQGQSFPPTSPAILSEAGYTFGACKYADEWMTTYQFSPSITLQPNHDYWLIVSDGRNYSHYGKVLTGTESPYFHAGVGELYSRTTPTDPITPMPGRALNFQLVGTPVGNVGVGSPAPSRAQFVLAVAPNPVRGVTAVTWSGAKGGVRFEVLDTRGRRVAQGMSAAGESGRWSWSAAGDDGRALPAGLYFVRARDEAGRSTSARITVVR